MSTIQRTPAAVRTIERAISEKWGELGVQVEGETGQPPLRTNILSLVLICLNAQETRLAREILEHLADAAPSRAIILNLRNVEQPLTAEVWAHCLRLTGGHGPCYDVVEIEVGRDDLPAVPNIVESIALSELPVFLLWMGQLELTSADFARISAAAERLIIDTRRYDHALTALCDYDDFLRAAGRSCIGSDLAWTRLETWRELLAQSFDPAQTAVLLQDVSTVEISFEPRAESEALYLAGWFTTRLGWQPVSATWSDSRPELRARDQQGRPVSIGMNRVSGSGVGLRAVRLMARSGQRATRVTVRRQGEERSALDIEMAGFPKMRRFVQHLDPPPQALIADEMLAFRRDRIYLEALSGAAQYARLCLGLACEE